jgi:hypothetical protein
METRNANVKALETSALAAPLLIALLALSLLTVALAPIALAGPHPVIHAYFPLDEGNRWVYMQSVQGLDRPTRDPYPMQEVRVVGGVRTEEGAEVFQVANYTFRLGQGSSRFADVNGRVIEFNDRQTGQWYEFTPGAQVSLPMFVNDCIHGSKGAVLGRRIVSVPAGTFQDCLDIQYTAVPCTQVGLVSETFAPGIGLIERRIRTGNGAIETWSLKYAQVNGYVFTGPASPGGNNDDDGRHASESPTALEPSSWGSIKAAFKN